MKKKNPHYINHFKASLKVSFRLWEGHCNELWSDGNMEKLWHENHSHEEMIYFLFFGHEVRGCFFLVTLTHTKSNVFLWCLRVAIHPLDVLLWVSTTEWGRAKKKKKKKKRWSHTKFMGHAMALLSALMGHCNTVPWEQEVEVLLWPVPAGCCMSHKLRMQNLTAVWLIGQVATVAMDAEGVEWQWCPVPL